MEKSKIKRIIIVAVLAVLFLIFVTLLLNKLIFQHEEGLVFVTKTGEKYHNINCSYLISMKGMGIEQAKAHGYTVCSRCGGVATGRIEINNYGTSFGISVGILLILGTLPSIWFISHEKNERIHPTQSSSSKQPIANALTANFTEPTNTKENSVVNKPFIIQVEKQEYKPIKFNDNSHSYKEYKGEIKFFVVSDIEGSYFRLIHALNSRKFNKKNENHVLVLCGDILGYSEDILSLQDFLCELEEQKRLIYIRGDRDYEILAMFDQIRDKESSLNNPICADECEYFDSSDEERFWLSLFDYSVCTAGSLLECEPFDFWENRNNLVKDLISTPLIQLMVNHSCDFFEIDKYILVHGWIPKNSDVEEKHTLNWRCASRKEWENASRQYHQGIYVPNKVIVCAHHMTRQEELKVCDHVNFSEMYPKIESTYIGLQSWGDTNCIVFQQDADYQVDLLFGNVYVGAFWICEGKIIQSRTAINIDNNLNNQDAFICPDMENLWNNLSKEKYGGKFSQYSYDYFPHGTVEYDTARHRTFITFQHFQTGKFQKRFIPSGTEIVFNNGKDSEDFDFYIDDLKSIFKLKSVEYKYGD